MNMKCESCSPAHATQQTRYQTGCLGAQVLSEQMIPYPATPNQLSPHPGLVLAPGCVPCRVVQEPSSRLVMLRAEQRNAAGLKPSPAAKRRHGQGSCCQGDT